MSPSLRSLLSAALLTGACACVTPLSSSRSVPAGAVILRFAWPEKLSARVTHTLLLNGSEGQRTYGWSLKPGPEKGQHRLVVQEAAEPPPTGIATMADPEYTVIFDSEGRFVSLEASENSPAMNLLKALPMNAEQAAEVRQRMEATQKEVAQGRWEQRVGHWRDVMLMPGETVRIKTRMWVGQNAFEREEVDAEERTTLETGVACSPDAQDKHCVRIVTVTQPLHPYHEAEPCKRARASKRFELVTDPQTLLPYLTRMVREDEMDSCREDGTVHTLKLNQGEEFVFTYGVEPLPVGTTGA